MPRKHKPKPPSHLLIDGERVTLRKGETAAQARGRHFRQKQKAAIVLSIRNGATFMAAAQAAGINRATIYNWLNEDADFAASVAEAEQTCVSMVESALYANALKPEGRVDRLFFLKNRAGYRDVRDVAINTPAPAAARNAGDLDLTELTDAELEDLANGTAGGE